MTLYTFQGADFTRTTVEAPDEASARELAMTERWGRAPQAIGKPPIIIKRWTGLGLDLIKVENTP